MAKRFRNLQNGKSKFGDDWDDFKKDNLQEKESKKNRNHNRKQRREQKISTFRDFNTK